MSDWSGDDSTPELTTPADSYTAATNWFDSFMQTLDPGTQQAAQQLGAGALTQSWTSGEELPDGNVRVGNVSGGKNDATKSDSLLDKITRWSTSDKGMTSIATMLAGGLAGLAKGKRDDRGLDIQQQNANSNAAGVAERARQFDQQMANGSAIGQTNFGTAMQPMGMINAPVTLTRNRLMPSAGAPR
jgi:hypothetical protein